jgi:MFS family permease
MGVGVGEATVVPVTYSLLGDYFAPDKRGLAMGLFGSGIYLGMGAALLIGGALIGLLDAAGPVDLLAIGPLRPWQLALVIVGAPGLAVALLALVLLEPRRHGNSGRWTSDASAEAGSDAAARLDHYRRFATPILLHHLTVTFMVMALYAVLAWAPEHFRRSFGLDPSASGFSIGLVVIAAGALGVVGGGFLSDALVRRGVGSARLLALLVASACALPSALLLALAPTAAVALAGLAATLLFLSPLSSVGPAALQDLFPARLRGTGAAVYQLVANLIGLSLGPTAVALVTDRGFGDDRSLYASLAVTLPVMLAAAAIVALAGLKPFRRAVDELAVRSETGRFGRVDAAAAE